MSGYQAPPPQAGGYQPPQGGHPYPGRQGPPSYGPPNQPPYGPPQGSPYGPLQGPPPGRTSRRRRPPRSQPRTVVGGWLYEHRRFLVALPLALVVGLGFPVYEAVTGGDNRASRVEDVAKGKRVPYGRQTVGLVSLRTSPPKGGLFDDAPKNSVAVVATFRAKFDRKPKGIYGCESTVENEDGWTWDSTLGGSDYVQDQVSNSCDGSVFRLKGGDKKPAVGEWFTFAYVYFVPKDRARGLRPTLSYYPENPRFLRFDT